MYARAYQLSVAATIGMFIVMIMGATVTNTGSAEGCGQSWPLCHGQLIPELVVESLIEYSHRIVTGIVGLIIAALSVVAWLAWRDWREVQVLVPLMIGTLLLQSGLGASAVMYPQSPPIKALHFGISLIAFASVYLTMVFIAERRSGKLFRDQPVPAGYRGLVWGCIFFIYIVVYLGAFVRHTGVSLACQGWPLCNGLIFPGFDGSVGIAFLHRLGALGAVLLIAGLLMWAWQFRRERPDLFRGSLVAFILVLLQSLSGAIVVFTLLNLFSALLHAAIMTLLFGSLAYLCLQVLPRQAISQASHRRLAERYG